MDIEGIEVTDELLFRSKRHVISGDTVEDLEAEFKKFIAEEQIKILDKVIDTDGETLVMYIFYC